MKQGGKLVLALGTILFVTAGAEAQQVVSLSQTNSPAGSAFEWLGPQPGALAGAHLYKEDMSGDINRLDMLAGAPGSGPSGQGQVFIDFIGPPRNGGLSLSTADVVVTGENAGDQFGAGIGGGFILSQDVAGARYQDLVVGAPNANGGKGAVYLFPAPMTQGLQLSATSALLKVIGRTGDNLGASIAVADIDGDGYRDIIMAAPGTGNVYVVFGGPGLGGTLDLGTNPAGVMAMSGAAGPMTLATADFNGDGIKDVAIGYPAWASQTGAVFFVMGRARSSYPASTPAAPFALMASASGSVLGIAAGDQAGAALETANFDGDSYVDLVVGAPGASPAGRAGAGSAYVLWGGPNFATPRVLSAADVTIMGATAGAHLGRAVSTGYIRRDLQADLALLAPGASATGDIDVVYGAPRASIAATIDLAGGINRVIRGDPAGSPLASVLVLEVTGEGAEDILAAAPAANANAGIIYNVYSPTLSPDPFTTSATVAQGATQTMTVNIANIGSTTVRWAVRSNSPWLTVSPTTGTSSAAAPGVLTLTITPGGLPANQTYTGGFSLISTDRDVVWSTAGAVNVAVTPGQVPSTPPTNPTGTPISPDEGSPNGVYTTTGANVSVTPIVGVEVTFSNVISAGQTTVNVVKATETGSSRDLWGPWDYRISTTAVFTGPVTIGLAYDPSLVSSGIGTVRIVNNGTPLTTVRVYATDHFLTATGSGLPVSVNVENTFLNDFDGDGLGDLIWRRESDGALAAWFMNGSTLVNATMLTPSSVGNTDWTVVGSGDFNGDGSPDLLWWNSTSGALGVWFMNGTTMSSVAMLNPSGVADTSWRVVAVADVDGDGQPDLLWRNQTTGLLAVWFMSGVNLRGVSLLTPSVVADLTWNIVGVGDFDGDGHPDIVWRNSDTGQLGVWFMNGANMTRVEMLNPSAVADQNWQLVAVVDLDGDGHPDIVWQNVSSGAVGAWFMNGVNMQSVRMLGPGYVVPGWTVVTAK